MKLKVLTTIILLSVMGLVQLAAARPSFSQNDLNTQLQQALCDQNWGRALQVIDQMKKAAGRQYASQLTLYRGRIEVLARENAKVPGWTQGCATGGASSGDNRPSSPVSNPNSPMTSPGAVPEVPVPNSPNTPPEAVPEVPVPNSPNIPPDAAPEVPVPNPPFTPPASGQ